jgi:protein disulfide-isomerase A1
MTVFKEAAVAHKGKMLFAYAGSANQIQEKLKEFMGVTADDMPTLRAILPEKMKKFNAPHAASELTVANIGEFIDGIKAGTIKPHLKSAVAPETQGDVVVVVGTEFEKIVMDPTKDVLVKYYAPWCGHCKKLAPVWDELGAAFKDSADVVIAKFDATVNEADGVEVRGYPTLTWYPRSNKAGVSYEGERDLESFKKYITENAESLKEAGSVKQEEL